jgi:hypothetical protein
MLITGAQYVEPARPAFWKALASRPMALPVSHHNVLLNEQEVVIGSAVLLAKGNVCVYCTWEIPCVAASREKQNVNQQLQL